MTPDATLSLNILVTWCNYESRIRLGIAEIEASVYVCFHTHPQKPTIGPARGARFGNR